MREITFILMLFMYSITNAQNYTLSSIGVNGLNDNWCGDVEEIYFFGCAGSPDVFLEIYDSSNNLIFESTPTDNTSSLTLTLNIALNNGPYTIHLYDYDEISPNDDLGTFTINSGDSGTLLLTNSGSTITATVLQSFEGCTDSNAINYDPLATTNDGSCTYNTECLDSENLIVIDVLSDNWGYETSIELLGANGTNFIYVSEFVDNVLSTFNVCVPNNSTYVFTITDTYGDGICCANGNGYYTVSICGETVISGGDFEFEETTNIAACSFDGADTYGCTDVSAINYNPLATITDDSCLFFDCPNDFVSTDGNVFSAPEGSIVSESSIQLPTATENEMYSEYIQFYAPSILEFDGTVITFNSATINSIGNLPNGLIYQCSPSSCTFNAEQNGCLGLIGTPTETGVFDLDITASVSVTYDGGFLGDIAIDFDIPYYGGNTYLDLAGIDAATINSFIPSFSLVVQESGDVFGCTDPAANNYNALANIDDATCDYSFICEGVMVYIVMQTTAFADEISWELLSSNEDTMLVSSQYNSDNAIYNAEVCLNSNETYYVEMHDDYGDGWLGSTLNFSVLCEAENTLLLSGTLDNGENQMQSFYTSCSLVYGCTNELATNYNNLANVDDGTCIVPIYGCTDFEAVNYNVEAELDDGSCNFFECNESGISSEAGFYPPAGSSYNEDSSYVYLPDANTNSFYEEYLKFFAEDTMVLEGLEIGFISAKILNILNMPQGMYYQTSSADSTFYASNVGCVGLFGEAQQTGIYELSIEAEVTVEILGSPITFQLPYTGGVMILDLVYSDGDYSSLNSFIPTFVIEVYEDNGTEDILGCTTLTAENYNASATLDDGSCSWSQTIVLNNGWNLISTFINPTQADIIVLFSSIIDQVVIVKNNEGLAYLPEWNFNGIGDLSHLEGYQVKVTQEELLMVSGQLILPENTPLSLNAGWNLISYLRNSPADAILVFDAITAANNLVIAKDNDGNAYLPEWNFNGMGNLESGNGYQLKINNSQELLYLSNALEY
jgi:hypothetical protein